MSTVDDLKAGRELDRLIAEKVMGLKARQEKVPNGHGHPAAHYDIVEFWHSDREEVGRLPHYSTEISAAWKIVEKFGFMVHPTGNGPKGKPAAYWVGFPRDGHIGLVGDMENETVACAESVPLAIALAALKQVEKDKEASDES